jgi:hypothetical protein
MARLRILYSRHVEYPLSRAEEARYRDIAARVMDADEKIDHFHAFIRAVWGGNIYIPLDANIEEHRIVGESGDDDVPDARR